MNTSSHCACRTAALRIFVRSLAGPVPAVASAARQLRPLTTTSRPDSASASTFRSVSRFQPAIASTTTTTRALHASRRQLSNAQQAALGGAVTSEGDEAREAKTVAEIDTITAAAATEEPAATNSTTPTNDDAIQVQTPAETQALGEEVAQTEEAPMPGKNMRKRLRRQHEREMMEEDDAADAVVTAVGATDGSADAPQASGAKRPLGEVSTRLKKPKEKKEKKEKKGKLEKKQDMREARRLEKKDVRRKRRAVEKAMLGGLAAAASAAPVEPASPRASPTLRSTPSSEKPKRKPAAQAAAAAAAAAASSSSAPTSHSPSSTSPRPLPKSAEPWQIQKRALRTKFPEGWNPRKKLSPDALEGIRALHRQFPEQYTTAVLAGHFQVSAEAIRRILKSSWQTSPQVDEDRQARWFERGKQVWSRWAALGRKPPKRWQAEGIVRDTSAWSSSSSSSGERQHRLVQGTRQEMRQETRQQFQSRLAEEGVNESGGGGGGGGGIVTRRRQNGAGANGPYSQDSSSASSTPSSPTRPSPHLRPRMRSQSQGRLIRLRRARQSFSGATEE